MAGPVKRVCLLGAESTGKTTLARTLAAEYDTVWNPEFGRPYTEIGRNPDAPWTSDEFTHIARIQCWYEDTLARSAREVIFCDTDAFTTALFHQVYLGEPTHAFDDLLERRYDLYLRLRARGALEARRGQGVRGAAALDARAVPRAGGGERVAVGAARGAAGGAVAGELERGGSAAGRAVRDRLLRSDQPTRETHPFRITRSVQKQRIRSAPEEL